MSKGGTVNCEKCGKSEKGETGLLAGSGQLADQYGSKFHVES
jgi:hypothetical protein